MLISAPLVHSGGIAAEGMLKKKLVVGGRLEGDKGKEEAITGQDVKKQLPEEQDSCLAWRYGEAHFLDGKKMK